MTTIDGLPPEFGAFSDEDLAVVIQRAEMDLQLSRNDPDRKRRVGAILDAALAERWRRLDAPD